MNTQPHVVIVGGGFGGLQAAKQLRKSNVRVTLVDRHNYHLFQPLLYQVATGGLSPANIATPLRAILRKQANCQVLLAEVTDFDVANNRLVLADGELTYDTLVLAAGATHSYFGNDQWAEFAPGLKTLGDATEIRRRIYLAFEAAEREPDPEARKALMTFVVVGGGPTGVELAGTLSEIAEHTLARDFRNIRPQDARIMIIEGAPHVLNHYDEALSQRAADKIRQFHIEVHTHTRVNEITADHVRMSSEGCETIVPTRTVLWGAGVQANPLGKRLAAACGLETDRAGHIPVDGFLNVTGHKNIFAVGDIATCLDEEGKPLPGLAAVAMQQGGYVADAIAARVAVTGQSEPFKYHNKGTMATIGRAAAVVQIGKRQFCGFFAWLLWLFVHLLLIVQFQNRVLILFQWAWNYATFNRSARLITGDEHVVIVRQPKLIEATQEDSLAAASDNLPADSAKG
ncbi:NADH dehydrogenase-like protein YjlD [Rosistilla carotiformis]|uniref:NADH:ubiquinone reductase (non-electrogenic) n=1 Tax=Rosistilla carotiformis TaxID=2528017 RepID=A0A518K172_9BACT|nr:NAD(P)/FAD-dependent oxidoreductase [Rosistilla carotiformis]QDV71546.1 NADH dehydrogenase-like protein YjlD [Rosistilla carotiformis]